MSLFRYDTAEEQPWDREPHNRDHGYQALDMFHKAGMLKFKVRHHDCGLKGCVVSEDGVTSECARPACPRCGESVDERASDCVVCERRDKERT